MVEWPSKIDKNILGDVISFKNILQKSVIKEYVYIKPAYNSILIVYKFTIDDVYGEISKLKKLYSTRISIIKSAFKHWRIPVCYDAVFGLDLKEISDQKRMSKNAIIKLHSQAVYTVYFIGFLPGFLYLGGLDDKLHFPRKATPRKKEKKGAVAIGGNQTGVYPNESPGGWQIIGNSPISVSTLAFTTTLPPMVFFPVAKTSCILLVCNTFFNCSPFLGDRLKANAPCLPAGGVTGIRVHAN